MHVTLRYRSQHLNSANSRFVVAEVTLWDGHMHYFFRNVNSTRWLHAARVVFFPHHIASYTAVSSCAVALTPATFVLSKVTNWKTGRGSCRNCRVRVNERLWLFKVQDKGIICRLATYIATLAPQGGNGVPWNIWTHFIMPISKHVCVMNLDAGGWVWSIFS